jgi:hypothetical protein
LSDAEKQKEALNQFCNAIETAVSALRASLATQTAKPLPVEPTKATSQASLAPAPVKLPFDPCKIHWEPRKGEKGIFELSEDYDSPDHKALLKFLTEHAGGCISSEGFFYWTFTDAKSIGRKLKPPRGTT